MRRVLTVPSAPPTNQSTFRQWTIGPIYYSALIMAEALGPTGTAQVLDLEANNHDIYTPAYAIYENGTPMRVLLFNFITDSSGANDIVASISIGGNGTSQHGGSPSQVRVKCVDYLSLGSSFFSLLPLLTFLNSFCCHVLI
jgi:hypothetical protein